MNRAKGLFITGTDTGVGKTRVTAVLTVALARRGLRVGVMKPVETGCVGREPGCVGREGFYAPPPSCVEREGSSALPPDHLSQSSSAGTHVTGHGTEGRKTPPYDLVGSGGSIPDVSLAPSLLAQDSLLLRQISGCTAPPEIVTPYMFREPLAPAIAAQHEGREIDLDHIAHCYEKLAAEHDIVLVEGAGGLLVPLTREENFLDLAARLDLPILVVARNILGTINHTALTVTVALQACRVPGIVLNTPTAEVQDASQASNAEALQLWGRAPLLGQIPYEPEITPESLLKQSEGINLKALI